MENKNFYNLFYLIFNKWSNKKWFQVLFVLLILYFILTPILTPIFNKFSFNELLDERDKERIEIHKMDYENSKQTYALVKKNLQNYLNDISYDYAFLIEFHNGSENIVTGIQFCRFDVTLEVCMDSLPYLPLYKFKDDLVARYDILLRDDLSDQRLLFFSEDEFDKYDKYLSLLLKTIKAKSCAMITLESNENQIFGALLFVSLNEYMNHAKILECSRQIERLMDGSNKD